MTVSCAIYARYSSDLQRDTSLDDQIRVCQRFTAQRGWYVLEEHIYRDSALSGYGVEHRPAYQRMVKTALAPSPPFEVLLVDDLSRLSRDVVETVRLYKRLKHNGVELIAVADGIHGSHQMAKLQITVKGLMNELFLDDLREKTHRGLTGRAAHGLSAGGRLFGYRTVTLGPDGRDGAAWEVSGAEAQIVRRIFVMYAGGLSMRAIAFQLNREDVPFPAKDTRRGPTRQGWAVSTIYTILRNEKYRGRWVWNKTMFLKDPETGKRRSVPRPQNDWIEEERLDLRIVDADLWRQVERRPEAVRDAFGVASGNARPRGRAPELYSPFLLSGFLRCGVCGARMIVQNSQRKKSNGVVYKYHRYRCSFNINKGPAVCSNSRSIPQAIPDAKLLAKFHEALTPAMVDYLVATVNRSLAGHHAEEPSQFEALGNERRRIDGELANLVRFITAGDLSSPRLHDEIRLREERLAEIDLELDRRHAARPTAALQIHRTWVEDRLRGLKDLLAREPQKARQELQRHIEDLRIEPVEEAGARVVRITGRGKAHGLLGEEAVRLQLVAGAGYAECYTVPETYWVDLR